MLSYVLEYTIILNEKKCKFYGKMFKNTTFSLQKDPKGPQGPIGAPQDNKNYFFELPGYENHMVEKRIFELFPIEKKLVWPNQALSRHIGFWWITQNATRCQPGTARDLYLEAMGSPNHKKPGGGHFLTWSLLHLY